MKTLLNRTAFWFSLYLLPLSLFAQDTPRLILPLISGEEKSDLQFSSDGKTMLASCLELATEENHYEFYDTRSGKLLKSINADDSDIGVDVSELYTRDGRYLLFLNSGFSDHNVECWDLNKQQIIWKKICRTSAWGQAAGRLLIVSNHTEASSKLYDYEIISGGLIDSSRLNYQVRQMAFSPDSQLFILAGFHKNSNGYHQPTDDTLQVFSLGQKNTLLHIPINQQVKEIGFIDRGHLLYTRTDSAIFCFDASTGKPIFRRDFDESPGNYTGQSHERALISLTTTVYEGNYSTSTLRIWDARRQELMDSLVFHHAILNTSLSADEREVAVVTADTVYLYAIDSAKRLFSWYTDRYPHFGGACFNPQSGQLVFSYADGTMGFIDTATHKTTAETEFLPTVMNKVRFISGNQFITWNDHSTDHESEDIMALFGTYHQIDQAKKWSALDGRQDTAAFHQGISASRIVVSHNGQRVITFLRNTARIWDAVTGKRICRFPTDSNMEYHHLTFSTDGRRLAYMMMPVEHHIHNYWIKLRDARTGKLVWSAFSHDFGDVIGITPKADYILLEGDDHDLQLLSVALKKIVCTFKDLKPDDQHAEYDDDRPFFYGDGYAFTASKNDVLYRCQLHIRQHHVTVSTIQIGRANQRLNDVQVSVDQLYLFARNDSVIYKFSSDGRCLDSVNFHSSIEQYKLSADGGLLLAGVLNDERLRITEWDLDHHQQSSRQFTYSVLPEERNGSVVSLALSGDKQMALFSCSNGIIFCYNIASHQVVYGMVPVLFADCFYFDGQGHFDTTAFIKNVPYFTDGLQVFPDSTTSAHYVNGLVRKIFKP